MKHKTHGEGARARLGGHVLGKVRAFLGIDSFSFQNKVVLVTGGSRGLGLVLARGLAREGARVAILARNEEELARAKEDLRRCGADVLTLKADVRDRSQVHAAVKHVTAALGPVEVLINNAGTITVGPMELMTPEDYDDAFRTHVFGPLELVLAVLPEMRRRKAGRIINISSAGGKIAAPHVLPYVASKFALRGLSEGLRAELAKDGIVVTTVCPGFMRTGSPYNCFFKGNNRAECAWFTVLDSLPLVSMSAERAARIILRAARLGRAEVTPTLVARIAAVQAGLFPGLVANLLGVTNTLLPGVGGIGTRKAKGIDSQSRVTTSFLTALTRRAARENNELAPGANAHVKAQENG